MAVSVDGLIYEAFIIRAFRFPSSTSFETLKRAGAAHPPLVPAVYFEEGMKNLKQKEYDKYILKMQSQVTKALDKFLKMEFSTEELSKLDSLKNKALNALNTDAVMVIVREALEITQKYKEFER